jgi:hypothetical protein
MTFRNNLLILLLSLFACAAGFAEEDEDFATSRPGKKEGPTKVYFLVFVLDIDDINGAQQSFAANVYIHLRWHDPRLAHTGTYSRSFPLEAVWNPQVIVANQQGILRTSLPRDVKVTPEGMAHYHQRYTGALSQPLQLSKFPLDEHQFTIQFSAVGYSTEEIEFIPEKVTDSDGLVSGEGMVGGGIADELSLPDWKLLKYKSTVHAYRPVREIENAGFAFEFVARRHFLYYLWQVVVPLTVVVFMSWAAFWIDPSQSGTQIGVATSAVLSLIAFRFVLGDLLPRLPYMTRLDYYTLGSTLLVFFALVEVITTSYLARNKRERLARKLDRVARIAFPAVFILLFIRLFFL